MVQKVAMAASLDRSPRLLEAYSPQRERVADAGATQAKRSGALPIRFLLRQPGTGTPHLQCSTSCCLACGERSGVADQ